MRTRMVALCMALVWAFCPGIASAQINHWDGGPPWLMGDWNVWTSIVGDHLNSDEGHCDNTNGDQQGFPDVDCKQWNDAPQAPIREIDQDCGTGSCTVSTTVRCMYLRLSNGQRLSPAPPGHYYTFTCTGPATGADGGVMVGKMAGGKKGVRCGPIECGCQLICPTGGYTWPDGTYSSCYNEFFGFPAMVGGNPGNYVCQ